MTEEGQPATESMPAQPGQAFPAPVAQLLLRFQLGAPLAIYEYDRRRDSEHRFGGSAVGLGCAAFPFLVIIAGLFALPFPGNLLIGLPLVALLVGLFYYFAWRLNPQQVMSILLCPGGLLWLKRNGEPAALPWDQITSIKRGVRGATEDHGAEINSYTLECAGGATFSFEPQEFLKRGAPAGQCVQLGHIIEQEFVVRRLPHALSIYHSGVPVVFGPMSVSLSGISNGADTLPWSAVSRIELEETGMNIRQQPADLIWYAVSYAQLPNAALLQGLLQVIRRSQP